MNGILKRIYDSAPVLRPILATGYGYKVKRSRYGKETEEIVAQALERESWSAEQWRSYEEERLAELLHHASRNVPYYRRQWEERRRRGDHSSVELLENWPILRKDDVRTHPQDFLRDGVSERSLIKESTSGSTGTPVTTWRSVTTLKTWYGLAEARWRNWYGVKQGDRWGILGGKLVVPFEQERPPYWVWNAALSQLYISTFHLKPSNTQDYLDALRRYKVRYLYGYASSLYALAHDALEQGLEAPRMTVAISNAEPLLPHQRQAIEEAFGCPAKDTYGMSEAVAAAGECKHGSMHLWPEVGTVEVFADDEETPVPDGTDGRLICTSWLNWDMPLIRYEVGDRGAFAGDYSCSCGRTLPTLERIVGRLNDNLVSADGRRIYYFSPVYFGLNVKEAQIIQSDLQAVTVRVVPSAGFSPRDKQTIMERMRERLGNVDVHVETINSLEREPSGKLRAVVCRVYADERIGTGTPVAFG